MTSQVTPTTAPLAEAEEEESAQRTFSFAIIVSAVRCTLTYVLFPFVLPWFGLADWETNGWDQRLVSSSVR